MSASEPGAAGICEFVTKGCDMKMNSENQMESVRCGGTGWGPALIMTGVIVLSACGGLNATSDGAPSGKVDAAVGAADGPAKTVCDPLAPFGPWVSLGIQGGLQNVFGQLSSDETTIYFGAFTASPQNNDLYMSRRTTLGGSFGTVSTVTLQNSSSQDFDPSVSNDGLSLWFATDRTNVFQIYVATRANLLADFDRPGLARGVNSVGNNSTPFLSADNSELWFTSDRAGGPGQWDIWHSKKRVSGFEDPIASSSLSSDKNDWSPTLSTDGLTIYISSDRVGGQGGFDVWRAHRNSVTEGFPAPMVVDELNTAGTEYLAWISTDNCRVYGQTNGTFSVATRQP
jgi:hypothetical protein